MSTIVTCHFTIYMYTLYCLAIFIYHCYQILMLCMLCNDKSCLKPYFLASIIISFLLSSALPFPGPNPAAFIVFREKLLTYSNNIQTNFKLKNLYLRKFLLSICDK